PHVVHPDDAIVLHVCHVDPARPIHKDPPERIEPVGPSTGGTQGSQASACHVIHPHNMAGNGNVDLAGTRSQRWVSAANVGSSNQKRPEYHSQNTRDTTPPRAHPIFPLSMPPLPELMAAHEKEMPVQVPWSESYYIKLPLVDV